MHTETNLFIMNLSSADPLHNSHTAVYQYYSHVHTNESYTGEFGELEYGNVPLSQQPYGHANNQTKQNLT